MEEKLTSIGLIVLALSPLIYIVIKEIWLCRRLRESNRRKLQEIKDLVEKHK
jgi:flagellar biogenesis protein FliO